MTVYSYAQLEGLWIAAGGPKALAPIAAAIAEAESGGNSDALNPNDNNGTQSSYGLWQISNGTHQPPAPDWANPAVNAQLAVGKWKGAGDSFSPWGTYDSGAYKAFLSAGTTPDGNIPGSPTAAAAQTLAAAQANCLIPNPITGALGQLPLVGGLVPQSCLVTKPMARAVFGALVMGAGMLILGVSLGVLFAQAGSRSRLVQVAVGLVPAAVPRRAGGGRPSGGGSAEPDSQGPSTSGAQARAVEVA